MLPQDSPNGILSKLDNRQGQESNKRLSASKRQRKTFKCKNFI